MTNLPEHIEHVLFDLDGTLISSYMDAPGRDFNAWQVLPGRIETVNLLRNSGVSISIITNQAGVAFGHVAEADVVAKLCKVAQALDYGHLVIYDGEKRESYRLSSARGQLTAHVAYEHPKATIERYQEDPDALVSNRRKPSPVMLLEALAGLERSRALMVGDRPEDNSAANNAGVRFVWAEEFFGV